MQTRSLGLIGLILLSALMLAGCATPAYRIRRNPELFASFPPDVQEKVRKGQVDIGFSPAMVTMALGRPAHIYRRQTATGTNEVWSYVDVQSTSSMELVRSAGWYEDPRRGEPDWIWVDVKTTREYETLRLEFEEQKVKAVETLNR
jgi:hypothetical protein